MVDWESLDYSDPCALLQTLRPVHMRLISGQSEFEIEGTDRRRVRFNRADIKALENVIRELESQCAAKSGKRRRFAMQARMRPCQ